MKTAAWLPVLILLSCTGFKLSAQRTVLLEVGATYLTNNFPSSKPNLNDFLAFTLTPRILVSQNNSHALSIETPLSFRSKFGGEGVRRTGIQIPLVLAYSYGAGANALPAKDRIGVTGGIGIALFYQQAASAPGEIPAYDESVVAFGPFVQAGFRIPFRMITLFHWKDQRIYPVLTTRFSHLIHLISKDKNVGGISVTLGMGM